MTDGAMLRCAALLRGPAIPGLEKGPGSPLGATGSPLSGLRRLLLLLLLLLGLSLDRVSAAAAAASPAAVFPDLGPGKCGAPWPVANARIAYENSKKLRYTCVKNFKRKAGTSSLIFCEQDPTTHEYRWSRPPLVCIDMENAADGPRRETTRPTQTTMSTNPASLSTRLYGSQTNSPIVVETSRFTDTPRRTAKPTPDSLGSTVTATPEGGRLTPGTISKSVTPSPRTTPFSPDESSKTQWTPRQITSAPSEGPPGNVTEPSDTSVLQKITGSVYFRAGIPFLAVILSAGFMYYCYCRRSRHPWRQPRVPSVEEIPMDPMGSKEGTPALAGDSPDPGPVNEEDPMLTGLPPPVE
ncbi:interleukin-15 receptor subunit alpha isoform X2 [Ahaetulla prasina]|uniref:interleukin-15 receptor subunit alpha isoform X2 n=1 Tax=Ahaetulla prasina TaxID=499056 RepID=UPI0026489DFA|nr:interleukin-15 receptor subunit alpha isoform X2 [Ahaetulla prasina]